ncbi:catechol O-methyltransferase-like [Acanthaster planci]|uniref:catechol O-methyltransferase n=1 Tax=Acanthaster planci TaxID=133434 RepID=A0A8B7Y1C2_ACAPL|nr:catechol O-methyltransferase-like [Acanthaster planci]XP_022086328.1 catechol O-methyltransferase-like [Acanthaster planci]
MVEQAEAMTQRAGKMLDYVVQNAVEGDAASIIRAADDYGYKCEQMMHVGAMKGEIVRTVVKELAPKVALELGTYFGYSAVLTASVMPEDGQLLTVEFNEKNADIARKFIQFARMDDKVTLIQGDSREVIKLMHEVYRVKTFDFVFLDHWKDVYKRDLKLLEENSLLHKGTVILADNMIRPGSPAYLKYVETSDWYQTERKYSKLQYSKDDDALAKSVYLGP